MDLDGVAGGDYYKLCDLDATFNGAEWDLDDDIFGCPTPGSESLCGQCGGASPGYGWCDGQCKGGPDSDVIDLVALPRNGATSYYNQRSTDSCVDSPPPAAAGVQPLPDFNCRRACGVALTGARLVCCRGVAGHMAAAGAATIGTTGRGAAALRLQRGLPECAQQYRPVQRPHRHGARGAE